MLLSLFVNNGAIPLIILIFALNPLITLTPLVLIWIGMLLLIIISPVMIRFFFVVLLFQSLKEVKLQIT